MNILQVNTADRGGGAEGSARNLFRAYRDLGHSSWMLVGQKLSDDPDVFEIPRIGPSSLSGRLLYGLSSSLRRIGRTSSKLRALCRRLDILACRERRRAHARGCEDLSFPGTAQMLDVLPGRPDVIHCHNLHGWYFDLRALVQLSREYPVILNLRDAWLLAGHCGYFIDCDRWRTGCGECPDLERYPGIRRDATHENWLAKRDIFSESRLHVTAPSEWLLACARSSILSAEEYRLIPNGIDLAVFNPVDRSASRKRLGFAEEDEIVLFAAASPRNVYKDPETMIGCVRRMLEQSTSGRLKLVCLGRRPPRDVLHQDGVYHVPFQSDPGSVADYYRAADLFIHTARAEAFGKTATEAMACGTPVIATAVGGLAEQIIDGETGYICTKGDAEELSSRALQLLRDSQTRMAMGMRAASRGAEYGLERQVKTFIDFYADLKEKYSE